MRDIRPALRSFLLADATVSGLVGGERIYHVRLPQGKVEPSAVYNKISEFGDYHMLGDSGLGHMRMQIDAWAQNADAAVELANAIYDRISGASGLMDDVVVQGVFLDSGRDDYDAVTKMFRISRDFIIWYGAEDAPVSPDSPDAQSDAMPMGMP
jgi:hypothetical protein